MIIVEILEKRDENVWNVEDLYGISMKKIRGFATIVEISEARVGSAANAEKPYGIIMKKTPNCVIIVANMGEIITAFLRVDND